MEADRQAIRRFIERIHGPEPSGWLIIWTRQDKATRAFDLGTEGALERAVEYCALKASAFDVYAAVGLQYEQPANGNRGAESGVVVRCVLTCTKHLWAWDLKTLEMKGETERPLKTYEVKQENGAILANIEEELTYEFEDAESDDDDFFK